MMKMQAQRPGRQTGRARAMLFVPFYRYLGGAIETVIVMALFQILAVVALCLRARLGFVL